MSDDRHVSYQRGPNGVVQVRKTSAVGKTTVIGVDLAREEPPPGDRARRLAAWEAMRAALYAGLIRIPDDLLP